jgi:hypothetical protein
MMIFLKTDKVKEGIESFYLSSGTNKSISNFRETIPLTTQYITACIVEFKRNNIQKSVHFKRTKTTNTGTIN